MTSSTAHRGDLAAGARAMLPWLVGVTPFGLVIGVAVARADIPALAGWLTGPLIYAASAQISTIHMLHAGAAPVAIVMTALVINLRLILYSAAMARHWRGTPLWFRLLAAYLLIEPSLAVGVQGYGAIEDRRRGHAYYLGGAAVLWAAWLSAIGVGATAGAQLPDWLHLEFLVPLYLIGQVVPKLTQPATRRAVLIAAAVAPLVLAAPLQSGLIIAILAGIAAGMLRAPRTAQAPNASEEVAR